MHLFLANNTTPWETVFRTEMGQPTHMTVESNKKNGLGQSTVDIFKVPSGQGVTVGPDQAYINEYALESDSLRRVEITNLARIRMRAIHDDEVTINGKLIKAKDLYRKKQMRTYGRDRIWTGSDGREYRWKMLDEKLELSLDDEAQTLVAKYHKERKGENPRPGSLEIFGHFADEILDMILITFVHVEKLRLEREEGSGHPPIGTPDDD